MALSEAQVEKLRRKASQNALEVEHLLGLATYAESSDAQVLRGLSAELEWSHGPGGHGNPIPFGTWADVVCAYLEAGHEGIDRFCRDSRTLRFGLGLLATLKSQPSVQLLNRLAKRFASHDDRLRVAGALNLVCSFRGAPTLDGNTSEDACRWLNPLLLELENSGDRATVVCALRGVGNAESLDAISQLPTFLAPWEGLEDHASRVIRKRLRNPAA